MSHPCDPQIVVEAVQEAREQAAFLADPSGLDHRQALKRTGDETAQAF